MLYGFLFNQTYTLTELQESNNCFIIIISSSMTPPPSNSHIQSLQLTFWRGECSYCHSDFSFLGITYKFTNIDDKDEVLFHNPDLTLHVLLLNFPIWL